MHSIISRAVDSCILTISIINSMCALTIIMLAIDAGPIAVTTAVPATTTTTTIIRRAVKIIITTSSTTLDITAISP